MGALISNLQCHRINCPRHQEVLPTVIVDMTAIGAMGGSTLEIRQERSNSVLVNDDPHCY
jgi:hypothetical protein